MQFYKGRNIFVARLATFDIEKVAICATVDGRLKNVHYLLARMLLGRLYAIREFCT